MTSKKIFRAIAIACVTLFLGSYASLTLKRNYEYSNIFTYWQTNINNFKDGYVVYNNLAGTFFMMKDYDQAIAYCWIDLMIDPNQPHVWYNLGKAYGMKKMFKEARDCFRQALEIDKGYVPASQALAETGKQ